MSFGPLWCCDTILMRTSDHRPAEHVYVYSKYLADILSTLNLCTLTFKRHWPSLAQPLRNRREAGSKGQRQITDWATVKERTEARHAKSKQELGSHV